MKIKVLSFSIFFLFFFGQAVHADTFIVTSNADSGPGTLREAIERSLANGYTIPDLISFNLPGNTETERTITLRSNLPSIISNTIIDGTTQLSPPFGVSDARVILLVTGSYAGTQNPYGLKITGVNVEIYGLYIKGINISTPSIPSPLYYGITIDLSANVYIGKPGKGNIINGWSSGIFLSNNLSKNMDFKSNLIGIHEDGKSIRYADGNSTVCGYSIYATSAMNLVIGGPNPEDGNILNSKKGAIYFRTADLYNGFQSLIIQHNIIGANKDATEAVRDGDLNESLIYLEDLPLKNSSPSNPNPIIKDNVIVSKSPNAVGIFMRNVQSYFSIQGNRIGVGRTGNNVNSHLSSGIMTERTKAGLIGGDVIHSNIIANTEGFMVGSYNYSAISLFGSGDITISKNSIYCNKLLGIYTNYGAGSRSKTAPQINITSFNGSGAGGTASPNATIEIFLDDDCPQCEGKTFIGTATANSSGQWFFSGNITSSVVATATDAMGETTMFTTSAPFKPDVEIVHATCNNNGSLKAYNLINGVQLRWEDSQGQLVSNDPVISSLPPGKYKLISTFLNSCVTTPVQTFEILNMAAGIDTTDATIQHPLCDQNNGSINGIVLTNTGSNYTCRWKDLNNTTISTSLDLTNVKAGQYFLELTVNGCAITKGPFNLLSKKPEIDELRVQIQPDTCFSGSGSIQNISLDGNYSFNWFDEQGNNIPGSLDLKNVTAGRYRLIVGSLAGCTDTSGWFMIGNFNAQLSLPIYNDVLIKRNSLANFSPQNFQPATYHLFPSSNSLTPEQSNQTGQFSIGPVSKDTVVYIQKEKGTCLTSMIPVKIRVYDKSSIFIPTAFTPNRDGKNDLLKVKIYGPVTLEYFNVYNRWGQIVFSTKDPGEGWNGSFKGKDVETAAFVWLVKTKDQISGQLFEQKGTVTLIR